MAAQNFILRQKVRAGLLSIMPEVRGPSRFEMHGTKLYNLRTSAPWIARLFQL